jgi:uncharacterized membrane protein
MSKHISKVLSDLIPQGEDQHTERAIKSFIRRTLVSRRVHAAGDDRTFGERVADAVAAFGGSWTFIFLFAFVIGGWVILNSYILYRAGETFDPYPYILLNLFLSMLAAVQAPVILMSQNRQAAKDRLTAEHDYEVNLKAELEVRLLHEKLDELREQKWIELVEMQQRQLRMLERLLSAGGNAADDSESP